MKLIKLICENTLMCALAVIIIATMFTPIILAVYFCNLWILTLYIPIFGVILGVRDYVEGE